jgi:L-threonylcarbamoyladenylate synthase
MDNLNEAIIILNQGGIVIFPTDTAFGIGCRIDNEKAIRKLFKIRKRPVNMAVPVLFDSKVRVKEFVLPFDSSVEDLMNKFWPGAITLILRCYEDKVLPLVRGRGKTLGVRIPNHQIADSLIKGTGAPILGPSANFHGEPTPYTIKGLDKSLIKLVDFVLEGKTLGKNQASTVVDCSVKPWKIIRQGLVDINS